MNLKRMLIASGASTLATWIWIGCGGNPITGAGVGILVYAVVATLL